MFTVEISLVVGSCKPRTICSTFTSNNIGRVAGSQVRWVIFYLVHIVNLFNVQEWINYEYVSYRNPFPRVSFRT